jgi:mRNA interferase RelE/StbE
VNVSFRRSFAKDLRRIRRATLHQQLQAIIEHVEEVSELNEIPNLKRLTSDGPYFRIRVGDYRIGLIIEAQDVTFVRFLHRRDIYRYFP